MNQIDDKTGDSLETKKGIFTRWKEYSRMVKLVPFMRRSFVMNGFDGVLTALGLVIGTFFLYLDGATVTRLSLIIPGLATTLAIGISGGVGAYLAETAERRKLSLEIKREMLEELPHGAEPVILNEDDYYEKIELKEDSSGLSEIDELRLMKVDPSPIEKYQKSESKESHDKAKIEKSINEKAEFFASIVLALVDGLSPALGSLIGLFIFFFVEPSVTTFILSFALETVFLFGLGAYLAKISKKSILKYGLEMVLAGIFTAFIAFLIGG